MQINCFFLGREAADILSEADRDGDGRVTFEGM